MIILALLSICLTTAYGGGGFSTDDMDMDELLLNALKSSKDADFLHSNDTLLVEMDMIITNDEWLERYSGNRKRSAGSKRGALRNKLWPGGIIPYKPVSDYWFGDAERELIQSVFEIYHQKTCVKFVPYQEGVHEGAIEFNGETGCSSAVGFQKGKFYKNIQPVNVGGMCMFTGILLHELGHAIGLKHEQTRPDRDEHVFVDLDNVSDGKQHNFVKYTYEQIDSRGIPYDYASIMHYGQYAMAKNPYKPTITALDSRYQTMMGQRKGLSMEDIQIVNLMYGCLDHCPKKSCPPGAILSKDCECMCKLNVKWHGNAWFKCNKGRTEPTDDCQDEYYNCDERALAGECESRRDSMVKDCRFSCGYCKVEIPQPTRRPKVKRCKDRIGTCERQWKRSCGVPGRYHDWLKLNCKKTCGYCTDSQPAFYSQASSSCVDDEEESKCLSWKKEGQCDRGQYKVMVSRRCRKTCGGCRRSFLRTDCVDVAPQCKDFAAKGECKSNPAFMNEYCRKTCGSCSGYRSFKKDKCQDANNNCGVWAAKGMCGQNPDYMKLNCAKTCGECK